MLTSADSPTEPEPADAIVLGPRWSRAIVPLLLIGIAALVWAVYPGHCAAWLTASAAGWIAAFLLGCDKIGTLLWCLGAALTSGPLCIVITHGTSDDIAREKLVAIAGFLLLIVAAFRFLLRASRKTAAARGPNAAMVVVTVFTLIIPVVIGAMISRVRGYEEEYQETTQMLIAIDRVGADVEAFRVARGKLPADEGELVAWRGAPMPTWGRHGAVRYHLASNNTYYLESMANSFWGRGWDIFGYIVTSGGPKSNTPIHVELF
jgi:hypothetical protein